MLRDLRVNLGNMAICAAASTGKGCFSFNIIQSVSIVLDSAIEIRFCSKCYS